MSLAPNVFWNPHDMFQQGISPTILAIGDSWFWYPLPGGSLLNPLGKLLAGKGHVILAVGENGAEAYDYMFGIYKKRIEALLDRYGKGLSAVFISGAGNDFAGFNDLRPLLNADCRGAASAVECFRPATEPESLDWLMGRISSSYQALVGRIMVSTRPDTRIVMHTYDYAFPNGRGVFGKKSNWLKPALADARVPDALHHDCVKSLIDRFADTLQPIVATDPGRIRRVDSRNTLVEKEWANELHPKGKGFRKLVKTHWKPVLENLNLA